MIVSRTRPKLLGAFVFVGPDGAGLTPLPEVLPQITDALNLPLFCGSRTQLEDVIDRTEQDLQRQGFRIKERTKKHAIAGHGFIADERGIIAIQMPFWERPQLKVILTVERA